jgi:hypothetical protein
VIDEEGIYDRDGAEIRCRESIHSDDTFFDHLKIHVWLLKEFACDA